MWVVAPTRLDHRLSPMHSESTWFTSVRSLAETDSPGRAQTGTRLAASPGVSDSLTTTAAAAGGYHGGCRAGTWKACWSCLSARADT